MKNFWTLYKRSIVNYPSEIKEAAVAAGELGAHLLVLTFPLTFPVLYPAVMLWKKVRRHG